MNRVHTLEAEIRELSATEFAELREWFLLQDAENWDRQIEEDAKSGKLDKLFLESLTEHRLGKSQEL